ncbi:MAG TPA: protein phosphatase 2C domain-containing protein [Candidatus Obscuribacterales bacterium]
MPSLSWEVAAATDRGCLREDNQDNYYVSADQRIVVIADGMGGERGGALASKLAVEAVEEFFWQNIPDTNNEEAVQEWLMEAVSRANQSVYKTRLTNPQVARLGTTIVIAAQSDTGLVHIAHLGDSRAYRVTANDIAVLTQDHSVGFELVLRGQLTLEQYETSPFRNYLTRCVGHEDQVVIDQSPAQVEAGDWLLLCTDGLTGVVREDKIASIVRRAENPQAACEELVKQTLAGGAPDNVTVICAQYAEKTARVNTGEHPAYSGK